MYEMDQAAEGSTALGQAEECMARVEELAASSDKAADFHYNRGNIALASKKYQEAVDAYKKSLLLNPGDLEAKENYIYARKMLQDQQDQQNQQNQQNQDQNNDQNQDQNQDNNQDQNKDQDQNNDQNKDQNQNNNQDKDQDKNDQDRNNGQNQQGISPQAAQQMLQAIQAKEAQTQEKVKKEKAEALKSRQKEKNW